MTCEVLQTGSSGNCVILNGVIALDMGVSYKKVAPHVRGLQLVFVSHEHGDHFKPSTIRALAAERPMLRFCGGDWMACKFAKEGVPARNIDVLEAGKRYNYGAFQIEPVTLYHDVPNFGLLSLLSQEKSTSPSSRMCHLHVPQHLVSIGVLPVHFGPAVVVVFETICSKSEPTF